MRRRHGRRRSSSFKWTEMSVIAVVLVVCGLSLLLTGPGALFRGQFAGVSEGPVVISTCGIISEPSSYVLDSDILDNESLICIDITSNDVLIDCQGHTIDGIDMVDSSGIHVYRDLLDNVSMIKEQTNITIRNCHITDWDYGVYVLWSDNITLENVSTVSNNYGVYISGGSNETIRYATVDYNTQAGIRISQGIYPIGCSLCWVFPSYSNLVSDSNLSYNTYGFHISNSRLQTLTNIRLNSNDYGIQINSGQGLLDGVDVTEAYLYNNSVGIMFRGWTSKNTVMNSSILDSLDTGILFAQAQENNISDCYFDGNTNAITLQGADNNIFSGNHVRNSLSRGIWIQSGDGNLFYNNLIEYASMLPVWLADDYTETYWNMTLVSSENIVNGPYLGGNCYISDAGDGFSDICADLDGDAICDDAFDLYLGAPCISGVDCSNNTDYLPLVRLNDTIIDNNSNVSNTTYFNSDINNSNINNSVVNNSVVGNSTVDDSDILNSDINNSDVNNSLIFDSNVINSTIDDSSVDHSNTTNSTISNNSAISDSDIVNSTIDNSLVDDSDVSGSIISGNSSISDTTVVGSTIDNSTVDRSTITDSDVVDSIIDNSLVVDSYVEDSVVVDSILTDVNVYNSSISNSELQNCTIINSSILDIVGVMMNTTMINSTITDLPYILSITDGLIVDGVLVSGSVVCVDGYEMNSLPQDLSGVCTKTQLTTPTTPGGGGGGGSYTPSFETKTVDIGAGLCKKISFTYFYNHGVTDVTICVNRTVDDAVIRVEKLTAKPSGVELPQGTVWRYFNVTTEGLDQYIVNATIRFILAKSLVNESGDSDGVRLLHWNSGWDILKTEKYGEIGYTNYYESDSPAFSVFAVVLRPSSCVTCPQPEITSWLDCENGLQIRMAYSCSVETDYFCVLGIENRSCVGIDVCPQCPSSSAWSDCEDGVQLRTESTCNDETVESCKTLLMNRSCVSEVCPICPESGGWSNCVDGMRSRVGYICDENIGYECQSYDDVDTCYKIGDLVLTLLDIVVVLLLILVGLIILLFFVFRRRKKTLRDGKSDKHTKKLQEHKEQQVNAHKNAVARRREERRRRVDEKRRKNEESIKGRTIGKTVSGVSFWDRLLGSPKPKPALSTMVVEKKRDIRSGAKGKSGKNTGLKCAICGKAEFLIHNCDICGKEVCYRDVKFVNGKVVCTRCTGKR
ncbi:MAG: NosD domain-containing protein [Candidatus Aenigmatarchaeota archaeon]